MAIYYGHVHYELCEQVDFVLRNTGIVIYLQFQTDLSSDLVSTLSRLDVNNFPHVEPKLNWTLF